MSRRKQKRPQQLVNPAPGSTRILSQGEQLTVKSLSFTLTSDSSSSSSSSLLDCQPPLAPRPSPRGLHTPSLPTESSPPSHSPSQPAPYPTSLPHTHCSLSPDFPHPSLSSQAHSPAPPHHSPTPPHHSPSPAPSTQSQPRPLMASPKLGVSATTTSSSSSSSSSCAPPHPGSPSPVPEGPPSPVTPSPSPSGPTRTPLSIAVILEELQVLQQRQIYQMQMTEEICRQVLQLGGATCSLDSPPLPQLCLEGGATATGEPASGAPPPVVPPSPAPPLLACFPTLHSQSLPKHKTPHPLSHVLRPLKSQYEGIGGMGGRAYAGNITHTPSSSSSSSSSTSSTPTAAAVPQYPPSLALGLPPRYLHEKSPNTTSANSSSLAFFAPPLLGSASLAGPSQEQQPPGGSVPSGASSGRLSHACRFCGKLFSSDSSLQIHLRSHTGERPYQCPVCLSRFTTRGNLKVHFLRHREQNPELSLSLLPPSLFGVGSGAGAEQSQPAGSAGAGQKRRKRRAEEELFGEGSERGAGGFSLGVSPRPAPSSLPLPPSVDLALLSTAHSLLQLNRAAAAAAAVSSSTGAPPCSSSASSSSALAPSLLSASSSSSALSSSSSSSPLASITSLYKGPKRFDENTPPHPALHPHSAFSQLAHLPKILFPTAPPSHHHHPGLALLRPPPPPAPGSHLAPPHAQLTFPFSPFPKAQPPPSSDTSKLQRLVEKLEKEPPPPSPHSSSDTTAASSSSSSSLSAPPSSAPPGLSREMIAALGANGSGAGLGVAGGDIGTAPNQCAVCLRVLSCPRALRLHQATHLGDRPFPCKLCGRSFSTKGNLRAHQATHRARPLARAQNSCPLCQRKFTNALVLQHHIRMHLGGQLPPGSAEPLPQPPLQVESRQHSSNSGDLPASRPSSAPVFSPIAMGDQTAGSDPTPDSVQCSASVSVSAPPLPAEDLSCAPSRESSPDLIPPTDLSPDPALNPTPDTPPPGSAEPPVLSASVPAPPADPPRGEPEDESHSEPPPSILCPAPLSPSPLCSLPLSTEGDNKPPDSTESNLEDPPSKPPTADNPASTASAPTDHTRSLSPTPVTTSAPIPTPNPDTSRDSPAPLPPHTLSPRPALGEAPDPAQEPLSSPTTATMSSAPKNDKDAVPEANTRVAPATDSGLPAREAEVQEKVEQAEGSARDFRKGLLSSPAKDDGSHVKAAGPEGDWPATPILPPPVSRPPEKKIYTCSECGKEYASRSGLKGHMKHHGVVVKGVRPTPRGARPAPPTTSGPASFWNQYQVFLTNSNDQVEDPAPTPANGSQGEEVEMPQLAKSPEKAQSSEDPVEEIGSEELGEESKDEPESEAM